MNKEKDPFYLSIVEALKPTTSNQDLNRTLYNFQNQINAIIFTRYHLNDVPEIFRSIWKLLLSSAGNSSSTTRLASYRATGAFLTRVTPYYPDIIHESFSDVTLMATIDVKSSAIIASSFAFISRYIATPFMKKFINQTPVFHHFSSNDPVFSEHLPNIISNLGHMGKDWLKNLLQFFLEKIDESTSASRYLIKAVTAIVGHNPKFFIHHIIEWMRTNTQENKKKKKNNDDNDNSDLEIDKKYISLFTFFISGHQKEIEDSVDLYSFAKSAALILNGKNNLTDIDSAFLMLSVPSNSFRVTTEDNIVDENGNKSVKIVVIKTILKENGGANNDDDSGNKNDYSVVDDETEKVEIVVNTEKLIRRPSFYMINLPLESLKPTPEDSNLVLGAKFKSISQYYTGQRIHQIDNQDRTPEVFDIYEPYLKSDYNEVRSAALQGLALCINKFIEQISSEKLNLPLRSVLLVETVSWFHSFDILRIIKNISDYRLFIDKFGIDFLIRIIKQLTGFCFCENESLSKESTLVLADITTIVNLNVIVQTISEKTDFFDPSILKRSCMTMTAVIEKVHKVVCKRKNVEFDDTFMLEDTNIFQSYYDKVPSIEFYSTQLIEAAPLYFENLSLLSEILRFFSIYKTNKMNKFKIILNAAIFIIISTIEVISGQTVIVPDNLKQFINSALYSTSIVEPNNSPLINSPLSPTSSAEVQKPTASNNSSFSDSSKDLLDFFKSIVQQDIMHKNIDIITESFSGNDYKSFIMPMKYALLCSFLYVSPSDGVFLSNISHQLFPIYCSKYYNRTWMEIGEFQHNKILTNIPRFLRYVNDLHVHAEWCKICMKKIDVATTDDHYLTIVDFLVEISLNFFKSAGETDPYFTAIFSKFLYEIHYGSAISIIEKYLTSVYESTQDKNFLKKILGFYPEAVERWPKLFEGIVVKENLNESIEIDNDEKNKIAFELLISKSKEIELNGKKIENIYSIENDQIQPLFEQFVKQNNVSLLKKIIEISEDRKVSLDLKIECENIEDLLEYSKPAMSLIADYIARNRIKIKYQTFKRLIEIYSNKKRGSGGSSFVSGDDDNENEEQDEDEVYLRFALNNLKTIFEPYCISLIENDPSKLLDSLLRSNKVKKREISSLLCLVNKESIQFDLQSLYKLSVKLLIPSVPPSSALTKDMTTQDTPFGTAKKQVSISRYRTLLLFLAVTIQQIHFYFRTTNFLNPSSIVTLEFTHNLIHQISPDFERLPVDILAYLFLILAQTIPIDNDCVLFIWRLFALCIGSNSLPVNASAQFTTMNSFNAQVTTNIPSKSSPYGHLHQILIGLSNNTRLVGKNYVFGLADVILPCLQSKAPSKIMTGLRLVEQACLSVSPNMISMFIQKAIEIIIHKYRYILYYIPPCSEQVYRTFMSFLTKKNAFQQQQFIFNYFPDFTFISPHSGGFNVSVAFYPAVFKLITPSNCDNFSKIYHFACETLFKYPLGFSSGLKSLIQYVNKISDDEKESVIVDQFVNWLKIVKDSKNRPSSYSEFNPETENIKLYKTRSENHKFDQQNESDQQQQQQQKMKVSTSSSNLKPQQQQQQSKEASPQAKKSPSKAFSLLSRWTKRKGHDKADDSAKKAAQQQQQQQQHQQQQQQEEESAKKKAAKEESNESDDELNKKKKEIENRNEDEQFEDKIEDFSKDLTNDIEMEVENSTPTESELDNSEFISDQSQSNNTNAAPTLSGNSSSSGSQAASGNSVSSPPKAKAKRSSNLSRTYLTSFHQFYFGYTFCPNYKLTKQVGEWIDSCLTFMTPSKAFSILVFNFIRCFKFGTIYPKILKLFIENRDDEDLNEMFDGIVDVPQCECHRIALRLFKTCDKYEDMIKLASFDNDCEESKKLVDELMVYLK